MITKKQYDKVTELKNKRSDLHLMLCSIENDRFIQQYVGFYDVNSGSVKGNVDQNKVIWRHMSDYSKSLKADFIAEVKRVIAETDKEIAEYIMSES